MQCELAAIERVLEVDLELVLLADLLVLAHGVEGKAAAALELGLVQRDVDVLQEIVDG